MWTLRLIAVAILFAVFAGPVAAQQSATPNLCASLARDISSRYSIQLLSGTPTRIDRAADPLVGRFATAVQLYDTLQCPMTPLTEMLECLQVAANNVSGDMRAMISQRGECERQFHMTITGGEFPPRIQ